MNNAVLKLKFSRAPQNDIFTLIHGTKLDLWRCCLAAQEMSKTLAALDRGIKETVSEEVIL
jgi:hypothetical protein